MKLNLFNNTIGRAILVAQQINVPAAAFFPDGSSRVYVQTYHNGREQGLCLVHNPPSGEQLKIVWSEFRKSDDIVVYYGPADEFNQGNTPSDDVYDSCALFDSEAVAAKYISSILLQGY